jgi:lysozyme
MDASRLLGFGLLGLVAYLLMANRASAGELPYAEAPEPYEGMGFDPFAGAYPIASQVPAEDWSWFDWGATPAPAPAEDWSWSDWGATPAPAWGTAQDAPAGPPAPAEDWSWSDWGSTPAPAWGTAQDTPAGPPAPAEDWSWSDWGSTSAPTWEPAVIPSGQSQADANVAAFLTLIRTTEGTERLANPYAAVYGYVFEITDFSDHPANLGWKGERLPDQYCRAAGLSPGCVSTAAGAYQFIRPTWNGLRARASAWDFSPESQDRAAMALLDQIGALPSIQRGDFQRAIQVASSQWASLPYSRSGQPKFPMQTALQIYQDAGGLLA